MNFSRFGPTRKRRFFINSVYENQITLCQCWHGTYYNKGETSFSYPPPKKIGGNPKPISVYSGKKDLAVIMFPPINEKR